jgi:hypothetical protein
MEKRCHKCGSPIGTEQAFCPKCGAVIGMNLGTTQVGGGWDMASTVVGQRLPTTPPPRASAERRAHPDRPEAAPAQPAPPAKLGGSTILLAVIGFVAVLLIGGLLILLLYLNSQG